MPGQSKSRCLKLISSKKIPKNAIKIGCFVRTEKLYDPSFFDSVVKILRSSDDVHFLVASQSLPSSIDDLLMSKLDEVSKSRFHHLGWVNTKEWAYCLDNYDSSPRGHNTSLV